MITPGESTGRKAFAERLLLALIRSAILDPLTVEWRWTESEELAFQVLKKLCSNVMNMFGIDPELSVNAYTDAFKYGADLYIGQLQKGEMRLILYDFIVFNSTQRNYDTYKRKLFAIVMFIDKYEHIFNGKEVFIIHIDHEFLIDFKG